MNVKRQLTDPVFLICVIALFVIGSSGAQEAVESETSNEVEPSESVKVEAGESVNSGAVTQVLEETEMDLPALFDPDFGMQPGSKLAETLRPLSKIDMDGDMNYDGSIDNNDSTDAGVRENMAPGLQLGVGELSKLVIRYKTYEKDFPGDLFVKMTVSGINRLSMNGRYSSEEEEMESVGGIRVWAEKEKKTLLLDSSDPQKRVIDWKVDEDSLSRGLPAGFPRVVYVEGAKKSQKFEGDVRLMISSSHSLSTGENRQPSSMYRTAFDHILFTILEEPVEKGFVNDNAEGVWPGAAVRNAQAAAAGE